MANTFKNAAKAIGATATTVYTCPASTTGVIHAIYISNIHATNDVTVDITVTDTSASATFHIAKNLSVPNGSVAIFEKPINLEATDILKLNASAASSLEAFASILEMT
jgi:hypothetical protein|tara:strand:- start:1070 stop:1393 length:324 start_codon:yes stop_codon:yes gene_type:complete